HHDLRGIMLAQPTIAATFLQHQIDLGVILLGATTLLLCVGIFFAVTRIWVPALLGGYAAYYRTRQEAFYAFIAFSLCASLSIWVLNFLELAALCLLW